MRWPRAEVAFRPGGGIVLIKPKSRVRLRLGDDGYGELLLVERRTADVRVPEDANRA